MRNANIKVDGVDSMPAANYNAQRDELENAVLSSDQTLDLDAGPDTDLNMLGKAMGAYANAGNVYQDSGVANTYVLSLTTNLKTVTKYYDNMMVIFKAGNANTGASTINVNTLGAKSFTLSDGTALAAGNVSGGRYMLAAYSLSNDRFELVTGAPASSIEYNVYIHATDGDYPTYAAYLADSPTTGDDVFWDVDETFSVGFTIPAGTQVTQAFGRVLTFDTAIAGAAITMASNAKIKGRLSINFTHAGTIVTILAFIGNSNDVDDLFITGAGTITNGVTIASASNNINAQVDIVVTSLTLTNPIVDSSNRDTNVVEVQVSNDKIYRSDGANTFTGLDFGAGVFTQNSATGLTISTPAAQVTVDLGTVTAGDIFIMSSNLDGIKGVTAGICTMTNLKSSGVATIESLDGKPTVDSLFVIDIGASEQWIFPLTTIFKVLTTGTLIMKVQGSSGGSNSTSGKAYTGVSFLRRQ